MNATCAVVDSSQTLFDPALTPERDRYGMFSHPHLDRFCVDGSGNAVEPGDEGEISKKLLAAAGYESRWVEFDDDESSPEWMLYGECGDMSALTAEPPDGSGWQLVGMWDTEDGAGAMWIRPIAARQGDRA